mgnify:CR=1 FL=1
MRQNSSGRSEAETRSLLLFLMISFIVMLTIIFIS